MIRWDFNNRDIILFSIIIDKKLLPASELLLFCIPFFRVILSWWDQVTETPMEAHCYLTHYNMKLCICPVSPEFTELRLLFSLCFTASALLLHFALA